MDEDILVDILLLQLIMMKKKEPFLQEFDEGPLNFKPTYKFDRKAESYDIRYPVSKLALIYHTD